MGFGERFSVAPERDEVFLLTQASLLFHSRLSRTSLFRSGVGSRGIWKHRLDDLETGNVGGCVHVQEDRGVAEELLDTDVEHHAVAPVKFHGVLANLEDLL